MNTSLYYCYSFIRSLVPIYPVYLLLFESNGLTLTEISLLLAIWSAPVILLELPTGILADYWKRKNMLFIGDILRAACFLLWFLSDGFLLYAMGFILWGTSEAFFSGSLESLLFDGLKKNNLQDSFDRIYGKGDFLTNTATAISMLTGGFLAMFCGMHNVLLICIVMSLLSALIASRFTEVNYFRETQKDNFSKLSSILTRAAETLKDATHFFTGSRVLLLMAILSIFGIGVAAIIDEYDQLLASGYGLNLGLIGLWGGIRYFMEAIGSALAYRVKSILKAIGIKDDFATTCTLCALAGVLTGVAGWTESIWFIPLFGIFYMVLSAARILQEDILQQKIEEQGRSTVHSIISLVHNLFGMVMFALFAVILSNLKVFAIMKITSIYLLILCLVMGIIYRFVAGRKKAAAPAK